ncbi:MAG TPA: hypothetical protein VNJ01_09305 [Bacteriovoracaceae bacterium]|nr:hypothetical protein [Bacteriovoracaceae bacterium]
MKNKILVPVLSAGFLLLTGCSSYRSSIPVESVKAPMMKEPAIGGAATSAVNHIESWPEASRAAANNLISKYGEPQEMNASTLVWYNTAPFKRSIVYKEEVTHLFPVRHTDVLEQVVDYRVPGNKVDDLWRFDGSVLYDRTKGELSARCDKEEMNVLALNLADKISRGEMSAYDARRQYSDSAALFASGTTNVYTSGINFRMGGNTADADMMVPSASTSNLGTGIQAQESRQIEEDTDDLE